MPSFLFGLLLMACGFVVIGYAVGAGAWLIFPGIALSAIVVFMVFRRVAGDFKTHVE